MSKIQIICSSPGIRRNGIEHPASAIYDADRWSDKQLKAFRDDPAFIVQEVAEGGVQLSGADVDASIAAKVKEQVEKISQGLQAAFETTVSEKVAEKLADVTADRDKEITDLKAELAAAQTKVAELEASAASANKPASTEDDGTTPPPAPKRR